jgi:hypothetical protein
MRNVKRVCQFDKIQTEKITLLVQHEIFHLSEMRL